MAAVNQRRPTHDNARADHLEAAAVPVARLFTPTRFPLGPTVLLLHRAMQGREDFCLSSIALSQGVIEVLHAAASSFVDTHPHHHH